MTPSLPHQARLTPDRYSEIERKNIATASYGALRFFKPVEFAHANFPIRVASLDELHVFADIMDEFADRHLFLQETKYSQCEINLIQRHIDNCRKISSELCNRTVSPVMGHVRAMDMLRLVGWLTELSDIQRPHIFEIGAGSGALASFLTHENFPYAAYDITQSLYLWQHQLLRYCTNGEIDDWVNHDTPNAKWQSNATMIPWWHYARLYQTPNLRTDIVVCNRAIGEMETNSFTYILRVSEKMLSQSSIGAFIFNHVGANTYGTVDSVVDLFRSNGFAHHRFKGIEDVNILLHPNSPMTAKISSQNFEGYRYGATPTDAGQSAVEFLRLEKSTVPETYFMVDFIRGGSSFDWDQILIDK